MPGFLSAHGYDPGPTQRPNLAGSLSGLAASVPATALLLLFGSLRVQAAILGLPMTATLAAGAAAMALAGAAYGALFQRGANDRRGGWLFGGAFGFLLWAAGGVMILPLVGGGIAPAGRPAIGLFLALVAWGAIMGALFPRIHAPLHAGGRAAGGPVGPDAAAQKDAPRADARRGPPQP